MKKTIFIFVILTSLLLSSGCVDLEPCVYNGVQFFPHSNISFYINNSEIEHKHNYSITEFSLKIIHDNKKEIIWKFKQIDFDDNNNRFKYEAERLSGDKSIYKYKEGKWSPFSISLENNSTDEFISNKTFFNNTNIVTGKILIGDGGRNSKVEIDNTYSGIFIWISQKSGEIVIHTQEWSFDIIILIHVGCTDP